MVVCVQYTKQMVIFPVYSLYAIKRLLSTWVSFSLHVETLRHGRFYHTNSGPI